MDYVPAHGDTARKDDREDLGGARAFDGEDQGIWLPDMTPISLTLPLTHFLSSLGYGNRLRMQQLQ